MRRLLIFALVVLLIASTAIAQRGDSDGDNDDADTDAYCAYIRDGRINDDPERSCAAPVIIYADPIRIFTLDPETGVPELVLEIDADEIADAGVPEEANITLAEAVDPFTRFPVVLSRLTTGEFQVNAFYPNGEGYIVIWDADGDHRAFTYYPDAAASDEAANADTSSDDDRSASFMSDG